MTQTASPSREIQQRLDCVLEQLAAAVRQRVPSLRYAVQHGGNESFPWWVVARFTNGTDEAKAVDVSIDCQGTPQGWSIHADVAREDGLVLQELPALTLALPDNGAPQASSTGGVIRQLDDFLVQQADCLAQELA